MITLKQGDTGTGIKATLSDEDGPVNLSGAAVRFYMAGFDVRAAIRDAANGVAEVTFTDVHTAKEGIFKAEFEVIFSDGRVETFPSNGYEYVNIMKEVK